MKTYSITDSLQPFRNLRPGREKGEEFLRRKVFKIDIFFTYLLEVFFFLVSPFQWAFLCHGEGYHVSSMVEIQMKRLETSFSIQELLSPQKGIQILPHIHTANAE